MTRYWSNQTTPAAMPRTAEAVVVCLIGSDPFAPKSGQPEHIRRPSSKDLGNLEEGP